MLIIILQLNLHVHLNNQPILGRQIQDQAILETESETESWLL